MEAFRCVVLLAALAAVNCEVKMMSIENTSYVEVMNGYMLTGSKQMNISNDLNKLTMQMKMLTQITHGTEGNNTDFSAETMTVTGPTDVTVPIASKQISATVTDTATVFGTATVMYDLFTAGGNITRGTEVTSVMEGDVKVSFKLEGFNFGENVTELKLTFAASGSETPSIVTDDATTDGMTYNLGGNGKVKLSKKLMTDVDTYADVTPVMANNMFSVTVNLTSVTSLEYSVVLALADANDNTGGDPNSSTRVTSLGGVVALLMIVQSML